jgi:hypothetical protein
MIFSKNKFKRLDCQSNMSAEGGLQIAEVFSERGRIWDRRPDVTPASGLISIIKVWSEKY